MTILLTILELGTIKICERKMRYLIFGCLIFIGISCKEKRPAGILSKPEMVIAIKSVYLNEERINRSGLKWDSAQVVLERIQEKSFEKIGISDSTFKNSLNYYVERPAELDEIYSAVIDSLNLMEQRMSLPDL
jgi:hypothetical protein